MRNLINLIIKNAHWLLFLLLSALSVYFIIKNNAFQRSKYLAVEREVIGRIYSASNTVTSYIGLKSANEDLIERVAELERENEIMENYIRNTNDSSAFSAIFEDAPEFAVDYICARVVNNSISNIDNLITLNKGSLQGVVPDMGVFSPKGVVGIVMTTSPNFSVVIPLLNSKSNLSCKVKGSNYSGALVWDGEDSQYAFLEELPRHVEYKVGDTIVTSGYSSVFPEGLRIGTIIDSKKQKNDNFFSLKVKLFTNFSTVSNVLVVKNSYRKEQESIETDAKQMIKGGKYNGN